MSKSVIYVPSLCAGCTYHRRVEGALLSASPVMAAWVLKKVEMSRPSVSGARRQNELRPSEELQIGHIVVLSRRDLAAQELQMQLAGPEAHDVRR